MKMSDIAVRRASARANGDAEYRQRRRDLIEAAARVFRRKGFSAAKLRDISDELGIDRASIYYYTSGKEELYQDAVSEAVREIVAAVEALEKTDARPDEKLASFVTLLMEAFERHHPYLHLYVQESMSHSTDEGEWSREMKLLSRRYDNAVRAIIGQGMKDGLLVSDGDPRILANAIIGMCNWSYRWFQPGKAAQGAEIGRIFGDMILNGLRRRDDPLS